MYMRKIAAAAVAIVAKYFAHRPTNRVICTSYKLHVQAWPFYMVYFRLQAKVCQFREILSIVRTLIHYREIINIRYLALIEPHENLKSK